MFSASRFFSSVIKKYCFFASLTPILFHLTHRVTVHLQQMEGGLNKIYMTIENLGQLVHVCRTVWNSAVYAHVFLLFFFFFHVNVLTLKIDCEDIRFYPCVILTILTRRT